MKNCACEVCRNNHDFDMSEELLTDFLKGKVTIFAGAGISTENRSVLKSTFYENIKSQLGYLKSDLAFPELMELFTSQANGRLKFLKAIKDRFEHIDSFPELSRAATRFHRELATFFPVINIVTTNWDTYFETFCKATPFVTDADLAFWDSAERKVLKIHGSVNNYGSLIATTTDYERCKKSLMEGIIGSILKTILATQTVLFVGYSLTDSDFLHIYDFVKKQMQGLHKQAYVVTPFMEEGKKFAELGLIPIVTDGTYFIQQIKHHAISSEAMISDDIYSDAQTLLDTLYCEHSLLHDGFKVTEYPQIIFSASYQDGMMHALERAINLRGTGQYSHRCRVKNVVHSYLEWQKKKLKSKNYSDVAYMEGYINGLVFLLLPDNERKAHNVPVYFLFGKKQDIYSFDEYQKLLLESESLHKASYKYARSYIQELGNPEGIVIHHPPWL